MGVFLYTRPSERVYGTLYLNVGVADPSYPLASMDDGHPTHPGRLLSPLPFRIVRDFGVPQQIDLMALIHHNLDAGASVTLSGNNTDAWWTPTLTVGLAVPPMLRDGYRVNIWTDLTALFPNAIDRTFRYWALVQNTPNSYPIAIGEWAMYSRLRNLGVRNIKWGSERRLQHPVIAQKTELLVTHFYNLGTSLRSVDLDLDQTDPIWADIDAWYRDAGGPSRGFVIVPNAAEADAWFAGFADSTLTYTRSAYNVNSARLSLIEMSRGMPLDIPAGSQNLGSF